MNEHPSYITVYINHYFSLLFVLRLYENLVFRRPNPRLQLDDLSHAHCIEQVTYAKLLGVIFKENSRFDLHVNSILKQCSQSSFLMKQLRCH